VKINKQIPESLKIIYNIQLFFTIILLFIQGAVSKEITMRGRNTRKTESGFLHFLFPLSCFTANQPLRPSALSATRYLTTKLQFSNDTPKDSHYNKKYQSLHWF
jgi:hypothetical protein